MRLFHLSDIHFGLEDHEALAWAQEQILGERPDAVIITGDLTMRARHREFAAAARWIRALEVPAIVAVGNHDLPYFNLFERFTDPYRRFRGLAEMVERDLAFPDLALVVLKTAVRAQPRLNWSKGWVTRRALRECLETIDALPEGKRALVIAHHPLREVGTRGTGLTRNGRRALAQLGQRPVVAVLSGHVHDPFDLIEPIEAGQGGGEGALPGMNTVRMIGAGTLSQRLRSTLPSFNELIWDGEHLQVKVRRPGSTDAPVADAGALARPGPAG